MAYIKRRGGVTQRPKNSPLTTAQHDEMASGAAPHIDHRHPFDDDVVEQVNLGLQEGADFGRLRRWIERSIQQARRVDLLVHGSRHALNGSTLAARRAGR